MPSWFDKNILASLKQGEKLFIVDLVSVSIFPDENLYNLANSERYEKTPFLYLVSSYVRNKTISCANNNLKYINKKQIGSWMVYCFEKV